MKQADLYDEQGILTEESMEQFAKIGGGVSCECPEHLVEILKAVKNFTQYQKDCIIQKPSDKQIHQWLSATSVNLEHILSSTIVNLARMEGLIDENNNIIDAKET